jgi:hypothetical protein
MRIEFDNQCDHPYNLKCIIETGKNSGEDIWQIGELLKQALLGIGYHPDTVNLLFPEEEENETKNS